jgi:hypothetical protein
LLKQSLRTAVGRERVLSHGGRLLVRLCIHVVVALRHLCFPRRHQARSDRGHFIRLHLLYKEILLLVERREALGDLLPVLHIGGGVVGWCVVELVLHHLLEHHLLLAEHAQVGRQVLTA